MPLLTHDETGAASVARVSGPPRQPGPPGPHGPPPGPHGPPRGPRDPRAGRGQSAARSGGVAVAERPAAAKPSSPLEYLMVVARALRKRLRLILFSLVALIVVGPLAAFAIGWMIFPVPNAQDTALTQVARFTFAEGADLAVVRPENVNRTIVTLDRVPVDVRNAVLAAEDATFYSNPGFDITGIGRAVWNQLTGGVGGGSTITQQYVKVTTEQDQATLWRKYQEVVVAVKISREQTKDQIFENYLNTIYFGRGAHGIQAAAQAYFGKDVDQLNGAEGALLAGRIQAPGSTDPLEDPARAQTRWTFVADQMVDKKFIDPGQREQMVFPTIVEAKSTGGGVPGDDRFHIYERAKAELAGLGITQEQIDTEGLTITTTVSQKAQAEAVDAVKKVFKGQPENLRTSLVSVDPRTGAIVAYFGGLDGIGTDYAGEGERPPGSSFKPFVLAAALQDGEVGLGSIYDGSSPRVFDGQQVRNSEGFDCDACTVKTAMTKSINTVFYEMGLEVGIQKVIDTAHAIGIPENRFTEVRGGVTLGDQDVNPVDMASAFATFAADGERRDPYIVERVVRADGLVVFDRQADPVPARQALDPKVARNVTEAMIDVAQSSGIAPSGGRPVAAKTGTVQAQEPGQNKDAWTVGYTPSFSTAVWVGTDKSEPIKDARGKAIFGRMLPGSIWQEYMNGVLAGTKVEQFADFEAIGQPPTADPGTRPPGDDGQDGDDQNRDGDDNGNNDDDGNGDDNNNDDNNNRDNNDRDRNGGGDNSGDGQDSDRSGDRDRDGGDRNGDSDGSGQDSGRNRDGDGDSGDSGD